MNNLGFNILGWGGRRDCWHVEGDCRVFLTNPSFRELYGNVGPVMVWLNLNSDTEVNELYEQWKGTQARIVSKPEAKPWKLFEFTAADLDGNLFRAFYDFSRDV